MKDVTCVVCFWIECCQDVWTRWFKNREDGAHEFLSVEQSLLEALVIDKLLENGQTFVREDFFRHLQVRYRQAMAQKRSFCVQQRAGNVFCKSREVNISANDVHSIQNVDTMGTMLDGVAYVEVKVDNGFILEPFENVEFYLPDEPAR